MFTKKYVRSIPANSSTILPPLAGVEIGARVVAIDLTDSTKAVTLNIVGQSYEVAPVASTRTIQFEVTQDESLAAVTPSIDDFVAGKHYFKNELVRYKGSQHRAKVEIPAKTATSFLAAQWENVSHEVGEVVLLAVSLATSQAEARGLWPCDGTIITAPWSTLHGTISPDLRGELLSSIGTKGSGSNTRSTRPAPGQTNLIYVEEKHLPRINIPLSITTRVNEVTAGKCSGRVVIGYDGQHQHPLDQAATSLYGDIYNGTNGGDGYASSVEYTKWAGAHNHSATFIGEDLSPHTHPATSDGYVLLNRSSNQQPYYPASYALSSFIRL